jgi:Rieske Fe-S protein
MRRTPCGGCAGARTRRQVMGEVSSALLAAMAGVALWPETAAAVPVASATGSEAGPGELAYPMPSADGVTIDRHQQVIVVRFQGKVYAFNLACPHENTALRWRRRDGRFQCPRHESQYQPDGTFIQGRATRNMDRFAVRRSGDTLVVDVNRLFHSDEQAGEWSAAAVSL